MTTIARRVEALETQITDTGPRLICLQWQDPERPFRYSATFDGETYTQQDDEGKEQFIQRLKPIAMQGRARGDVAIFLDHHDQAL